jgi:hypothetical protein
MNYIENNNLLIHKNIYSEKDQKITIDVDSSLLFMVKMTFIYSAVMDGWKVEKLTNNKFSFTKKNVLKHISLQSFIDRHIGTNLSKY